MNEALGAAADTKLYLQNYGGDLSRETPSGWRSPRLGPGVPVGPKSTYIREPPYFDGFAPRPDQRTGHPAARALAIFGNGPPMTYLPRGAMIATGRRCDSWPRSPEDRQRPRRPDAGPLVGTRREAVEIGRLPDVRALRVHWYTRPRAR